VQPTERLRKLAERLLRAHQLRAADALQLAAMVQVGGEQPDELEVVCFDERLAAAALGEGLRPAA
jgi:predicted nucleic acid-binding protein